jgi:glycerate 2-kinase
VRRLEAVLRDVVAAVDPAGATARAVAAVDRPRPAWLAAFGKAAPAMAAGAAQVRRFEAGIVVAPDATPVPALPPKLVILRAAHPVPDARSEVAGRAVLALAASVPAHGALVVLVSGGASALVAVPRGGLSLGDKRARTSAAIARGAPIAEVNRLRASLSAIKGGRLAAACRAPVVTVVVSDVVGDDPAVVGSGPTLPARPGDVVVIASGVADLARAAATAIGGQVVDDAVTGDVADVAARVAAAIAAAPAGAALVWAGEPTIRLPAAPGRGGRARQLALVVARELAGVAGWSLLAAGSDGIDGTADAAGAIVDGATWGRVAAAGIDGQAALDRCDAGSALAAVGADVVTGPTGVNHADLIVAVC